jgi:hypothetical protein
VGPAILSRIAEASPSSAEWGDMFDLRAEAAFHALFSGIRSGTALGLRGRPFHLSQADVLPALGDAAGGSESPFAGYFTSADLENALEEDFLDATRGSTNNAQGWKVRHIYIYIYVCVCACLAMSSYHARRFASASLLPTFLTPLPLPLPLARSRGYPSPAGLRSRTPG